MLSLNNIERVWHCLVKLQRVKLTALNLQSTKEKRKTIKTKISDLKKLNQLQEVKVTVSIVNRVACSISMATISTQNKRNADESVKV